MNSSDLSSQNLSKNNSRVAWIDMARGFVILYMIITIIFPNWFAGNPITAFFFVHPPRQPGNWHLIDVGAPAFVFILGLLYGVSFQKRKASEGQRKAILHLITRYGIILILGTFIIYATYDQQFIYSTRDDWLNDGSEITVFAVDVIFVLGLVGFIGLPFLFINRKYRIYAAYSLVLIFFILCLFNEQTRIINFSISSVHLGIYAAIFGYGAIQIIGSTIGEYLFCDPKVEVKKVYFAMGIGGMINSIIGFSLLPHNLTYLTGLMFIAVGITFLGLLGFIYIDQRLHKKISIFIAFGQNPFFIYLITVIPAAIIYDLILKTNTIPFEPIPFLLILLWFASLTSIVWILYRKHILISTSKIGIISFIILLILVSLLFTFNLL